ncbi:MAG: type II secretion system secretin GspD [Candidatus Lambdaproteobacteria bacterium]|nr:type II secretion system secretin GspD [Candidatus Lambdaproteobacteria bacterium]
MLLLVCLCLIPAAPLFAQQLKPDKDEQIEMNFRNVDVANFLQLMSRAFGIAFVWDDKEIRGKITLISPRKFNRADAFRIFETVLAMQGYTTIKNESSPVVQVVQSKDASRLPSPTRSEEPKEPGGNQFLTQIIPLRFADANQIKAVLAPIMSKTAALAVYSPANVLVLSDSEENINRIMEIVRALDTQPGDVEFVVIKLKYAAARKLEPILKSLTTKVIAGRSAARTPQQPGGDDVKIVAEERTNSLILVADPVTVAQYRTLIESLDVQGVVEDAGIKVFRLQHADAEELAKILQTVKDTTATGQAKVQAQGQGQASTPQTFVAADKPTNSLIVFGSQEVIETMQRMVAELDIRRPQVYVEALIMEISLEKSLQLGVRWQAASQTGSGVLGAGFPNAQPQSLPSALSSGTGAVVGIVGNEIQFQGQSFVSFSGFIQATRQDQDLNILANPQLLTLNNEEAEINVSQVVPISAKVVTNSNLQTTTEFEFKDIGVILKIRPQITGGDKVRLIIQQESSSVAARQATVTSDQQAITTLKRSINTQVLVDDNTTVAIGGLIQDQQVETETKVPCLGDIPVLGWFFRARAEELRKTNLIVFIRPHIIQTEEALREVSDAVRGRFEETRNIRQNPEALLKRDFNLDSGPASKATENGALSGGEQGGGEQGAAQPAK